MSGSLLIYFIVNLHKLNCRTKMFPRKLSHLKISHKISGLHNYQFSAWSLWKIQQPELLKIHLSLKTDLMFCCLKILGERWEEWSVFILAVPRWEEEVKVIRNYCFVALHFISCYWIVKVCFSRESWMVLHLILLLLTKEIFFWVWKGTVICCVWHNSFLLWFIDFMLIN